MRIKNSSKEWAESRCAALVGAPLKPSHDAEQFSKIYLAWLSSGKLKYKKPSIDHIIPKSKGGDNSLDNLQFLTWFENRCKNNMSQSEWNNLKLNIQEYFV